MKKPRTHSEKPILIVVQRQPWGARAGSATRRDGSHQLDDGPEQVLQAHPGHHHEGRERGEQPAAGGLREAGEAEEVVVGTSGKDAAVGAPAVHDAAAARRLPGLDQRGVAAPREVDVGLPLPVEVVEARDIGAYPVHRGHLEGRRGGGQADRHRLQPVAVTQQAVEEGHIPRRQSPLEDDARQTVDLHDQQPPVRALGHAAPAQTADRTVDRALQRKGEVVQGHRHCRSRSPARPTTHPCLGHRSWAPLM